MQAGTRRFSVAPGPRRALTLPPGPGRRGLRFEAEAAQRLQRRGDGRPQAGFVAHLIVSTDPTLTPSRAERAQRACGAYAAAARQVA